MIKKTIVMTMACLLVFGTAVSYAEGNRGVLFTAEQAEVETAADAATTIVAEQYVEDVDGESIEDAFDKWKNQFLLSTGEDASSAPEVVGSFDEVPAVTFVSAEEGLPEEEEEAVDYWEIDIRKQKIADIERNMRIDQAFKEAKAVPVPVSRTVTVAEPKKEMMILTNEQVIRSVLSEEAQAKRIDLVFNETVLSDILMSISNIGNINVVLDPALKNSVLDLNVKGVSLEEALLLISDSYGLGFKKVGNSLYMTYREKIREENLASKVIKMRNVNVEQARMLLKDIVKSVTTSDQINSLIVVGSPDEINRAEEIVNKIDQPQPQVILEAKIIEVNKDALKDLGVDWSNSMTINYQESGRPVDFANVEDAPGSAFKVFSIARNPLQFSSVIQMLEEQNKARVLSNPRVTTMNDKEAEIFVGDRIPYTVTTVSGGVATTDVRFEEPGIRLKITPAIIEEDFVVIKVEPEVSYIYSFRGDGDEYPWVKKRQATAYVRVKNNQPFVLGGLLNQEDKKNLYKVPFLGDVPLLGNLFSYEKRTILDTELIITIIPTIVYGEM
jgi:type II secretory pathway component GspD/PulD (secretin)